jgi:hypothetical protein
VTLRHRTRTRYSVGAGELSSGQNMVRSRAGMERLSGCGESTRSTRLGYPSFRARINWKFDVLEVRTCGRGAKVQED